MMHIQFKVISWLKSNKNNSLIKTLYKLFKIFTIATMELKDLKVPKNIATTSF